MRRHRESGLNGAAGVDKVRRVASSAWRFAIDQLCRTCPSWTLAVVRRLTAGIMLVAVEHALLLMTRVQDKVWRVQCR